jgi:peptide/nickel transport system substrate-binding protein
MKRPLLTATALLTVGLLTLSACGGGTAPTPEQSGSTEPAAQSIVIDASFDNFETIDPAWERSSLGNLSTKVLYDTLLTYTGDDMSTTVPNLATMEISEDYKTFTFKLTAGRVFSSGNPVTADDVVFSLTRVREVGSNNSVYLADVEIEKVDETTVKLTTKTPRADLPAIIASPPNSIVEKAVVVANGGAADKTDDAETALNAASAGSGPYILEKADFTAEIVFTLNEKYNGDEKPGYSRIIIRKSDASTQKMSLEAGESQIAMDLSPSEAASLDPAMLYSTPTVATVYLITNQTFFGDNGLKGLKAAIDYPAMVAQAGSGVSQATSMIPKQFAGAVPEADAPKYDLEAAKPLAAAFGKPIKLSYLSDANIYGLQFTSLAEKLQSQLQEAGFQVELAPTPGAVFWEEYSSGKLTAALAYWMPDYLDPTGYLVFAPSNQFGEKFANWPKSSPEFAKAVTTAADATDAAARAAAFTEFGKLSNAESPFVPILQPAINIGHAANVTGLSYNAAYTLDLADLKPAG